MLVILYDDTKLLTKEFTPEARGKRLRLRDQELYEKIARDLESLEQRFQEWSNCYLMHYNCTYYGCTLRFETPALVKEHERRDHSPQEVKIFGREFYLSQQRLKLSAPTAAPLAAPLQGSPGSSSAPDSESAKPEAPSTDLDLDEKSHSDMTKAEKMSSMKSKHYLHCMDSFFTLVWLRC